MATIHITTLTELQNMKNDLTADYILDNDINAAATLTWNGGAGFEPIGGEDPYFTGSFDGQWHKITDLHIDRNAAYVGLFGYVLEGSEIKNLGLEDVDITGQMRVGALVGRNWGTITNCYSTGSVSSVGGYGTGGLVGSHDRAPMTYCYSTVTVVAAGADDFGYCYAGGLVGDCGDTIEKCYASGSVQASGAQYNYAGGFAGKITWSAVTDCYAQGSAHATQGGGDAARVGGFVAVNDSGGVLTNCYSTGAVSKTGSGYLGGFCGKNYNTITNCFWDTQTSGTGTSDGGTGKTTAEMKTESTFTDAGWDFVNIWDINGGVTYPWLLTGSTPPSAPTELLCNGQTNPIDVIPSYFSAIYNDPNAGDIAKYYRIQVNKASDFTGRMLWDSGKTAMSDVTEGTRCDDISYSGQALSLNKIQYYWRIKFWDDEGQEGVWSAAANFTMAGSGAGEAGAGPWEEDVLEPTGEAKVEIPRRSGQWTTLEDVMRIHTSVNKNPLDAIEIAQAEVTCSNIDKHFNSFEEASSWYKSLEGYAVQLSVGCKVGGTPISRKLFTGIISAVDADRINQTAEIRVVDFLDYFGRVTIKETPVWQNISLTQLYKNLVESAFPEWEEGVEYFVEDLGDITVEAIGYEDLNLLSELKHIAESRGKRIFTDVNGKLVCRSRSPEGEPWDIRNNYNLEDVRERRDIDNVFNWIVVHARPHEIKKDTDPPGKIGGFTATPGDQKIDLSWLNPSDEDFEKVRIQYSMTGYPPDRNDGTNIYEGAGESKAHTGLTNGQRYYYSAFTVDDVGNWSEAAHTSAVAGVGGGTWGDDMPPSPVSDFRAVSYTVGSISLSWSNPLSDNYDYTYIRADYDQPGIPGGYPAHRLDGKKTAYQGTGESTTFTVLSGAALKIGRRYYFSAFVRGTGVEWSGARFATAIPIGKTYPGSGTLVEVTDTESLSGGGCLADQRDIPMDWRVAYGCFYSGTNGYYSKRLSFSKRGSASDWLKFKLEWDIYNWMSTGLEVPNQKSVRERRIGVKDDLSLNFSQDCGIAQVAVSKISESSTGLSVQCSITYTGPKRVGWLFKIKLTLEGRA